MDIEIIKEYLRTGSDEISYYKARFMVNPTLDEFVEWVLAERKREWGYIETSNINKILEYRYGEIVSECYDFEKIKKRNISLKYMAGGWTRMDYGIELL